MLPQLCLHFLQLVCKTTKTAVAAIQSLVSCGFLGQRTRCLVYKTSARKNKKQRIQPVSLTQTVNSFSFILGLRRSSGPHDSGFHDNTAAEAFVIHKLPWFHMHLVGKTIGHPLVLHVSMLRQGKATFLYSTSQEQRNSKCFLNRMIEVPHVDCKNCDWLLSFPPTCFYMYLRVKAT